MGEGKNMREQTLNLFIPIIYLCFPFVYFAMYLYIKLGTMLGYVLMILGLIISTFIVLLISNKINVFIGNIFSFIMSFSLMYHVYLTTDWHFHYTPVEIQQIVLFILLSILSLIPQVLVIKFFSKYVDIPNVNK